MPSHHPGRDDSARSAPVASCRARPTELGTPWCARSANSGSGKAAVASRAETSGTIVAARRSMRCRAGTTATEACAHHPGGSDDSQPHLRHRDGMNCVTASASSATSPTIDPLYRSPYEGAWDTPRGVPRAGRTVDVRRRLGSRATGATSSGGRIDPLSDVPCPVGVRRPGASRSRRGPVPVRRPLRDRVHRRDSVEATARPRAAPRGSGEPPTLERGTPASDRRPTSRLARNRRRGPPGGALRECERHSSPLPRRCELPYSLLRRRP